MDENLHRNAFEPVASSQEEDRQRDGQLAKYIFVSTSVFSHIFFFHLPAINWHGSTAHCWQPPNPSTGPLFPAICTVYSDADFPNIRPPPSSAAFCFPGCKDPVVQCRDTSASHTVTIISRNENDLSETNVVSFIF